MTKEAYLLYKKYLREYTPEDNVIKVYGKYGIGDACWAMNIAHNTAHTLGEKIAIEWHWPWDRSYRASDVDTENIIDQVDYIKKFYLHHNNIKIKHIFNSSVTREEILDSKSRLKFGPDPLLKPEMSISNYYKFDPSLFSPVDNKKVVVWNSIDNIQPL